MTGLAVMMIASLALSAYGTYDAMEKGKEKAKLMKDDIEVQREQLELQKQAADLEKQYKEAQAREQARKAKANAAVKQAITGADTSTYIDAISSINASLEYNQDYLENMYNINDMMRGTQNQRLSIQQAGIPKDWEMELDAALGFTGTAVQGAMVYSYMDSGGKKVNIPDRAPDDPYVQGGYSDFDTGNNWNLTGFTQVGE
jgi:hypothetical protein